ncbi:unnamed protein product [Pseudo-nitzschia multistriata]|uniref:Uncharacterized protein n=1 Tax=Pseudo-nitzschia multistriata TaxID=183589 RepID=A0A448Z4B6_9STRA|nr:unnamed protein product [Pseudo-nitzschia multistriata]
MMTSYPVSNSTCLFLLSVSASYGILNVFQFGPLGCQNSVHALLRFDFRPSRREKRGSFCILSGSRQNSIVSTSNFTSRDGEEEESRLRLLITARPGPTRSINPIWLKLDPLDLPHPSSTHHLHP